jgi:hypothetical protein
MEEVFFRKFGEALDSLYSVKYGSDKDYLSGTMNLELNDVKSYTLPEYGTIN